MVLPLEDTVSKLRTYDNVTYPILSVYLNTYHKDHPEMLREFRQLVVDTMTEEEQESVKRNISYIQGFLDTFPTPQTCRTLALFSGGDHLWEIITTELQIVSQIHVGHSPYLKPLITQLVEHKHYLVLLADREKAVFVTFKEGELEQKKVVHAQNGFEKVPQKAKGRNTTMKSTRMDQHTHEHLQRHLKFIGKEVDTFLAGKDIAGVLIGTHQPFIKPLEMHLSKDIQNKILGEFIADLNAPFEEIIQKSQQELLSRHLYTKQTSLFLPK